jgi:hypothetical protein
MKKTILLVIGLLMASFTTADYVFTDDFSSHNTTAWDLGDYSVITGGALQVENGSSNHAVLLNLSADGIDLSEENFRVQFTVTNAGTDAIIDLQMAESSADIISNSDTIRGIMSDTANTLYVDERFDNTKSNTVSGLTNALGDYVFEVQHLQNGSIFVTYKLDNGTDIFRAGIITQDLSTENLPFLGFRGKVNTNNRYFVDDFSLTVYDDDTEATDVYFDDFSSQNACWNLAGTQVTISGGDMGDRSGANPNYEWAYLDVECLGMSLADDFDVQFELPFLGNFGSGSPAITNGTDYGNEPHHYYWLSVNSNGAGANTHQRRYFEYENGVSRQVSPSYIGMGLFTATIRMERRDNGDGTQNISIYRDNVFQGTYTSAIDWNTYDDDMQHLAWYDGVNTDQQWTIDNLVVTTFEEQPVSYPYNYYDDFTSLDTSVWDNTGASGVFSSNGTHLECTPDGSALRMMQFKPDVDWQLNWSIEFDIDFQDSNAVHYAWFFDDTWSISEDYWAFFWNRDSQPTARPNIYSKVNGSNENNYGSATPTTGTFKYEKINNPNGTITGKFYREGSLINTITSGANIQSLTDRNNMYLGCNQNPDNDWTSGFVNLTVTSNALAETSTPLTLVVNSPTTNTRDNANLSVNFTVDKVANCTLYIDGQANATSNNVPADTDTIIESALTVAGMYYWNLSCTDGTDTDNSQTLMFDFDIYPPEISSLTPDEFSTSLFNDFYLPVIGNVTDDNLFRVNRTIFYPNGTVFYNNYSGDLPNGTTVYSWNDNFSTLNEPNGIWTMHIDASDSHTYGSLRGLLYNIHANGIDFFSGEHQTFMKVGYWSAGEFHELTPAQISNFDVQFGVQLGVGEYKWNMSFDRPGSEYNFGFLIDKKPNLILYNPDIAHFIWKDWYIDFKDWEDNGFPINVRQNATHYFVYTNTGYCPDPAPQRCVLDPAIGGLNYNNMTFTFEIDNCVPNWVCSGYDTCQINDTAECNSALDTNACGLSYTGDYSEFGDQSCNYCSYSLNLISMGFCNNSMRTDLFEDLAFSSCCNVTGLVSDCAFGNESQGYQNVSCSTNYLSSYATSDLSPVVIDGIVVFLITIVGLAGVVAMVMLYKWGKMRLKE